MFSRPQPLFYIGKFPVSIVGLIILIQIVGMLACTFTQQAVLEFTHFTTSGLLAGQIWRVLTYSLVEGISLPFLIGLYFFYQFGGIVEASLGRRSFAQLCITVTITAPLALILLGFVGLDSSSILLGSSILHLAVFIGMCVMHPNLPSFFGIKVKWLGLGFFTFTILSAITNGLISLALAETISIALALMIIQNKGLALIKVIPDNLLSALPSASTKTAQKKKAAYSPKIKPKAKSEVYIDTDIDKILDKISAQGIHSLTEEERAILEKGKK